MRNRQPIGVLVFVGLLLSVAGCAAPGTAVQSASPDKAMVEKAASLAFGTKATCSDPDQYEEYTCQDHPMNCNIDDWGVLESIPHAGCWQTVCSVERGITAKHGESGTKDFYYCERMEIGCQDPEGCPAHEVCIAGHKRHLTFDLPRTWALHGGAYFPCPYRDED